MIAPRAALSDTPRRKVMKAKNLKMIKEEMTAARKFGLVKMNERWYILVERRGLQQVVLKIEDAGYS